MRFPLLNSAVLSLTCMRLFVVFIPVKARPKSFSQSSPIMNLLSLAGHWLVIGWSLVGQG